MILAMDMVVVVVGGTHLVAEEVIGVVMDHPLLDVLSASSVGAQDIGLVTALLAGAVVTVGSLLVLDLVGQVVVVGIGMEGQTAMVMIDMMGAVMGTGIALRAGISIVADALIDMTVIRLLVISMVHLTVTLRMVMAKTGAMTEMDHVVVAVVGTAVVVLRAMKEAVATERGLHHMIAQSVAGAHLHTKTAILDMYAVVGLLITAHEDRFP